MYFINQADKKRHPIEMNGIHPIYLSEVEYYCTLEKTNGNSIVTAPVINQSLIDKNIDVVWDLFHEHLDYIHIIHGVPIRWCTFTVVLPNNHLLYPTQ